MSTLLQSALAPAGPGARNIEWLWWLMFWVTTGVFVLVTLFVIGAVWRRGRAHRHPDPAADGSLTRGVSIAVGLTVVTLFVLLGATMATHRSILALGADQALTINLSGHQFWWEVEYDDAVPANKVTTANEIHLPVGRPVVFNMTSRDVIHSFWVPNLHGKRDLIPGITSAFWLQVDKPGVYWGQCAEFCGKQHAHMRLEVVAEDETAFERWLSGQRQSAPPPTEAAITHGRDVFLGKQCVLCHTIRGTLANGRVGPDLTHVGSRGKIASGTLANDVEHMARWIRDPQHIKPGSQMPPTPMSDADIQAMAQYLVSLK